MATRKRDSPVISDRRNIQQRHIVLVVCEKSKTEYAYFKGLTKLHHFQRVQIFNGDPDPVNLISSALRKKAELTRTGIIVDKLWCVFDHDNRDERFDMALKQARNIGIEVAYSVPQFELWYLLHFEECFKHINSKPLTRQLKKYIPGYSKPEDYSEFLEPRRKAAVRNAKKIRATHKRDEKPETTNPATRVDLLVEQLFALFSRK